MVLDQSSCHSVKKTTYLMEGEYCTIDWDVA